MMAVRADMLSPNSLDLSSSGLLPIYVKNGTPLWTKLEPFCNEIAISPAQLKPAYGGYNDVSGGRKIAATGSPGGAR